MCPLNFMSEGIGKLTPRPRDIDAEFRDSGRVTPDCYREGKKEDQLRKLAGPILRVVLAVSHGSSWFKRGDST